MSDKELDDLREKILGIIYNQFAFPNSVVGIASRSARRFDHEKQADKLLGIFQSLLKQAELRARIETYQRLMLWLVDQDDNDKLALLAKDIDVELDKCFAELKAELEKLG